MKRVDTTSLVCIIQTVAVEGDKKIKAVCTCVPLYLMT